MRPASRVAVSLNTLERGTRAACWAEGQARSHLTMDARAARGAAPTHHFAATFAQESLRPTVRLKTGLPGCESLASTQK
jgi:hypothetical protein